MLIVNHRQKKIFWGDEEKKINKKNKLIGKPIILFLNDEIKLANAPKNFF